MLASIEQNLNEQINVEFYSAYLYLAMGSYFESEGLRGFANWMRSQFEEEVAHAMKLYHYIVDRGGTVTLTAIAAPPTKWESPVSIFLQAYEHEKEVTQSINKIVDLTIKESDHATHHFLQWFIGEQIEEESSANTIYQQLVLSGTDKAALSFLDRELGQRTAGQT